MRSMSCDVTTEANVTTTQRYPAVMNFNNLLKVLIVISNSKDGNADLQQKSRLVLFWTSREVNNFK